jgi:hypothetical protein
MFVPWVLVATFVLSVALGIATAWKFPPWLSEQSLRSTWTPGQRIGSLWITASSVLGGDYYQLWREDYRFDHFGTDPQSLASLVAPAPLPDHLPPDFLLPIGHDVSFFVEGWPFRQRVECWHTTSLTQRTVERQIRWSGTLANTAFFSVLAVPCVALPLGAGSWAIGTAVRLLRRRDYECWRCGYDLRGIAATVPCPECGRERTPA